MTTTPDSAHISSASTVRSGTRSPASAALDAVLEGRRAFELALGALVELSGGTEHQAAIVLSHLGSQLGLPTSAVGGFFLACLDAKDTDGPTLELVRRIAAAASPADHHIPYPTREQVARLYDIEPTNHVVGASETAPLDGAAGIAFRGELDMATRPVLEGAVTGRPVFSDTPLLLDLRRLTFCDIAGIRALSTVHHHVTAGGGRLHVRPPAALSSRRMLHLAVASGWLPSEFACPDTA